LDLKDIGERDSQAIREVATHVLNNEFSKVRGMAPEQLSLSSFPLLISRGLLKREFKALWPKPDEVRGCLSDFDYPKFPEFYSDDVDRFFDAFVNSMTANDIDKMLSIFEALCQIRPTSKILVFASRSLGSQRGERGEVAPT
jgi:hypothetical protein